MKEFLELIEQNEVLKKQVERLDAQKGSQPSDYIALAAEYGLKLTEADFQPAETGELSEDELDAVAGGKYCFCAFGGGGAGNNDEKTCACVGGGGGEWSNGSCRCVCIIEGVGDGTEY